MTYNKKWLFSQIKINLVCFLFVKLQITKKQFSDLSTKVCIQNIFLHCKNSACFFGIIGFLESQNLHVRWFSLKTYQKHVILKIIKRWLHISFFVYFKIFCCLLQIASKSQGWLKKAESPIRFQNLAISFRLFSQIICCRFQVSV